ncbi:MAG TPA: TVP38/TMEM64 family protein [Bacillales bacterium]|nr:TVP38/TMEM64 family protein [Bacillales bacterium]
MRHLTKRQKWIYAGAGAVLLLLIMILLLDPSLRSVVLQLFQLKTIGQIRDFVLSLGFWGPVILILLMILHSLTFIPAEIIILADLAIFGPVLGVVYSWIGSMLGAYLAFYLAKFIGRPIVDRFVSKRMMARFDTFVNKHGVGGLFILRLIPIVSFNALNYASGFTNISLWQFTWTTALGILPMNILFAFLYQTDYGIRYALVGLTVIGLILFAILFVKARMAKKNEADSITGDSETFVKTGDSETFVKEDQGNIKKNDCS